MQTTVNRVEEEWIAPWDALTLIGQAGIDTAVAEARLADLLKDGLIAARAKRLWVSEEPNIDAA